MAERGRDGVDLLVVGAEGLIVQVEEKDITCVSSTCNIDYLGYCRGLNCCIIVIWCRQSKIVLSCISDLAVCLARRAPYIAAFAVIVRGFCCFRHRIRVGVFVVDGGQSVGVIG